MVIADPAPGSRKGFWGRDACIDRE